MTTTFSTSKRPPSKTAVSSEASIAAPDRASASASASAAVAAAARRCLTNRPGTADAVAAVVDRKLGVMKASQQTHRFRDAASEAVNAAVASMIPLHRRAAMLAVLAEGNRRQKHIGRRRGGRWT